MNDESYNLFISYLHERFNETNKKELNGFEVIVDYYIDYPPDGLDDSDSDYFREEVDRLAQDIYVEIESKLEKNEGAWLSIESDKWRLLTENETKTINNKTPLEQQLEPNEVSLLSASIFELNEDKIESIKRIYNLKVDRFGDAEEKYKAITLVVDYYNLSVSRNEDQIKEFNIAGNIGKKLNKKESYKHFEYVAKFYRARYEHEESAKFYKEAVETALGCSEDVNTLIALTKNMRIQYELCSDEDGASRAFIQENKLKSQTLGRTQRIILLILYLFSDYCQSPLKVAKWAAILIIICAVSYSLFGITPSEGESQTFFTSSKHVVSVFFDSLYFSVVTFTTLGYGDFTPSNWLTRIIASFQALSGLFFTSLFLVALVRKYGRK